MDIIDDQEQAVARVVGQLIGTRGIAGSRDDVSDRGPVPEIDRDHAAAGIGHEEPRKRGDDTVGTGAIVGARGGRVPVPAPAGLKPAEIRGRAKLRDKGIRPGVDDVDDSIRTIGEIVGLGRRVDPTDIEGVHGAGRGVQAGHGDRNRREQRDGPLFGPALVVPRAVRGPHDSRARKQTRDNHRHQGREPDVLLHDGGQDA